MTLYRQLLIFTLILCFILFIGVWAYKLQSTRTFLEHQLEAHAQDTATSLGLSLSPLVAQKDLAGIETMMNAIFDRGYYKQITFSDVHGELVSKRLASMEIEQVPNWFINALPITTPGGESLVMAGWKRAGSIYVESHPGYAYQTLWQTFVRVLIYFLLTGCIVFFVGGLILKHLLKPLRRVQDQAEAICRKEYEIQEQIPKTRELKSVVTSMNKMTARVKEMFDEQAVIAEKHRENAFGDPLTGLGNRRYLAARVDSVMQNSLEMAKGLFLLVQIQDLREINETKGYIVGDQMLIRAAEVITETISSYPGHTAARLSGADFGVFLPDADKEDSEQLTALITERLGGLSVEGLSTTDNICSIGGVYYNTPCSFGHLLAKTDVALLASKHEGPNRWKLEPAYCDDDDPTQGKVWWRKTLEQSLADKAINLYGQDVMQTGDSDTPIHLEVFSRITIDDDNEVAAGVFIPLAEHAAVVTELDRKVVELVLTTYSSWQKGPVAINLSVTSLLDSSFTDWLVSRLKSLNNKSLLLYFEFPEVGVVKQIAAVRNFAGAVRALGHDIGIDHFGRSFSNFGYLKSLQPDYVKIDAAFTRELASAHDDGYFFIGALNGVAHSLDIKVIAEGVETEDQLAVFNELKVDGYQGYLVEKPKLLTSKV